MLRMYPDPVRCTRCQDGGAEWPAWGIGVLRYFGTNKAIPSQASLVPPISGSHFDSKY